MIISSENGKKQKSELRNIDDVTTVSKQNIESNSFTISLSEIHVFHTQNNIYKYNDKIN